MHERGPQSRTSFRHIFHEYERPQPTRQTGFSFISSAHCSTDKKRKERKNYVRVVLCVTRQTKLNLKRWTKISARLELRSWLQRRKGIYYIYFFSFLFVSGRRSGERLSFSIRSTEMEEEIIAGYREERDSVQYTTQWNLGDLGVRLLSLFMCCCCCCSHRQGRRCSRHAHIQSELAVLVAPVVKERKGELWIRRPK